jgi:O-antigen/teichoic acid export membrane protein
VATAAPANRLRGVASSVTRNAWGLADQALISAANFVTLVLLARGLSPSEFGAFVLAYTGLLLVNGLQGALVTGPHNIVGQAHRTSDYRSYTSSTAASQVVFALAAAALALLAAGLVALADTSAAAIVLASIPALLAWQAQEFARRVLYTEGRFGTAVVTDAVSYGGQAVVVAALVAADTVTPVGALLVVAVTSAAGALVGFWEIRASLGGAIRRAAILENWIFGRWLGAAIAASWFVSQIYLYLAAVLIDSTASGALRAAQLVLGPLSAFYLFLGTVLPIRFAARREVDGDAGLDASLRRALALTAGPSLLYCALTAIFAGPILDFLYDDQYDGYKSVVQILSLFYVVMLGVFLVSAALTARRQTKALFTGSLAGAVLGVALGWAFVEAWGVDGAAIGMVVGALVVGLSFLRSYRRPAPAPTAPVAADPVYPA